MCPWAQGLYILYRSVNKVYKHFSQSRLTLKRETMQPGKRPGGIALFYRLLYSMHVMSTLFSRRTLPLGIALFTLVSASAQRIDLQQLKPLSAFTAVPAGAVYHLPDRSPEERAMDVLRQLTFEEKLTLTGGFQNFCFPGVPRLGLRAVTMADASQGIRLSSITSNGKSVSFPGMQALAATWNSGIARAFGRSIGEECIAHGVDILLGPGINMQRLSVGGRNYEYMGEDPLLASRIAVPYVQGLQGQKIVATAKHFVGNDQEFCRHIASSDIDERTLREIYLRPWEAVIRQAGLKALMTGNNLVNGVPCSMHQPLLDDVLRKEFGFTGIAMTDWQNTNYFESLQYLVAPSGLSLMMPVNHTFSKYIKDFSRQYPHRQSELEVQLDTMVYANLVTLFSMGVYDRSPVDPAYLEKLEAHKAVARQCAGEAICLLKNEGGILPVATSKTILLTGAPEIHTGTGSGSVKGFDHVSFEAGLKAVYGSKLVSMVAPTDEQVRAADVVIYRLNKGAGEGHDIPFDSVGRAAADLERLTRLNQNVVVLVSSANGLPMPWLPQVKGLLWTFMLGQERGAALAGVISGQVNPSGHLPFTLEKDFADAPDPQFNYLGGKPYWHGNNNFYKAYWKGEEKNSKKEIAHYIRPRQMVHVPYNEGVFMGYRWYDKYQKDVQFPFGHGLSYTTFRYSDLQLSKKEVSANDSIVVSFVLTNTGKRAGAEVVQLYLGDPQSSVERPVRELKAFEKVFLKAGERRKVQFVIHPQDGAFWDLKNHQWKVEPGTFEVLVGMSSREIVLKDQFTYR